MIPVKFVGFPNSIPKESGGKAAISMSQVVVLYCGKTGGFVCCKRQLEAVRDTESILESLKACSSLYLCGEFDKGGLGLDEYPVCVCV